VLGNHDRELHFSAVRAVLVEAITSRLAALGQPLAPGALRFEPWFFYVRGRLYAEHGQQYDDYTSFRYLLWPVLPEKAGPTLALPMGNVTNRYLMGRMGYFNPHASDYILNVYRYFLHWLRLYAFSRRGLFFVWLLGSLRVVARMLVTKGLLRKAPAEQERQLEEVARQSGVSLEEARALAALQHKPITSRMFRLLRELWVDRAAIAVAMTTGTVALALSPAPLWTKLMLPLSVFPLVYLVYEALAEGGTIFTIEKEIPRRARQIAAVLPARVVTFGHTHKPRQFPLSGQTTFVDTGTWAPVTQEPNRWRVHGKIQPRVMVPGLRNYLLVTFHEDRPDPELVFGSWT